MNALGISLIWTAAQTSLFCLAGATLYLIARRRHPAWGAATLCGVLVMTTGIATLSFSPWPRWWTLTDARPAAQETATTAKTGLARRGRPSTQANSAGVANEAASDAGAAKRHAGLLSFWSDVLGRLQSQLQDQLEDRSRVDRAAPKWRWPAWLAALILLSMAAGLARVLLGWIALTRLLRGTRQVTDPLLVGLLARIRVQLRCRRPIELREMAGARASGSPAVVGWRRPVILLPADWRSWSADARRGILAHETAHVAHGDFLMGLAAQTGVILHFYNPLVHWLARRLRLEQELAADARGAGLAGGPITYATVLAQMALRQDDSRPLWAGRPFFPKRGTLMRRIEMLHNPRFVAQRWPSRIGPAALLAALALVGLAVSGLRGPADSARADDLPAPAKAESGEGASTMASEALLPAFDGSYLPAETIAVMSVKPLRAANSTIAVEPILLGFPQAFGFGFTAYEEGKTNIWAVDEVRTIVLSAEPERDSTSKSPAAAEPPFVMIYRMRHAYDPNKLRDRVFDEAPDGVTETICHGHKCFRAASEVTGDLVNFLLVDDRTIVVLRERDVARMLAADPAGHPRWYGHWLSVADRPIAVGFDSAAMTKTVLEKEPTDAAEQLFASALKQTALIFGHLDCTADGLEIGATAHCTSPEQAAATTQTAKGILALALMAVPQLVAPSSLAKEYQTLDVAGSLVETLSKLKLNVTGTQLRAEMKFDAAFVAQFTEATKTLLARQTEELKARATEDDRQHIAKLGRLAEAMNAYHAAHGHYPPAAVVGPDGKTLHSWRVELLPYLGEQELFESYKLDEPWDGEHNKRLIEKVPQIYSTCEPFKQGEADYYVVIGKGTLFDGDAPQRESITDAPGETILVLQSRRRIPWTRPVDIENPADGDPVLPLRSRGNGFYAAFADGTVKLVPKSADGATLRALFTKAGGDEVKLR